MLAVFGYLVLAALAASMVLCYQRPVFAFALVLILYPLKQLQMSYMPIFAQNSAWFNFIIFAGVCVAVVSSFSRTRGALLGYWNRYIALLLLMYVIALFSITFSPSQEYALERARDGAPYWVMQILLLPLVFTEVRDIQKFFLPFVIAGSGVIVLFLTNPQTNFYAGRLTLQIGYFQGVADYRGSPLATAQMGGQLAIVAALMLPTRATWFAHLARLVGVFLGLGIAVAAGSRGQLILALFVLALFWPVARAVRNIKAFVLNVVGFGVFAGIAMVTVRFFLAQDRHQGERWNLQAQIDTIGDRAWQAWRLIDAWLDEPLKWPFGLGTNAYSYISSEPHSYAHNLFIEMLGEHGIVGLTITIILLVMIFRASRDLWLRHREEPADRAGVAVMLALSTYLVLLSMKQGTFVGAPDTWYTAAIICKLMARERIIDAWHASQHQSMDVPLVTYDDEPVPESASSESA